MVPKAEIASTPWSAAARRRFGPRRLVAASLNKPKQAWPRQVATGQSAARPAHSKEFSNPLLHLLLDTAAGLCNNSGNQQRQAKSSNFLKRSTTETMSENET